MLTGYQTEIVAFIGDGGFTCYDCAHKALDEGAFARSERGLGELSPVIRYSLDEFNSETTWEYLAQEYDGEELQRRFDEAIDDDTYGVCCDVCGEVIR